MVHGGKAWGIRGSRVSLRKIQAIAVGRCAGVYFTLSVQIYISVIVVCSVHRPCAKGSLILGKSKGANKKIVEVIL